MRSALLVFGLAALFPSSPVSARTTESPDARAARVETQMTDEERYSLLHTESSLWLGPDGKLAFGAVKPTAGYAPGIPRLGIPPLMQTDGSLGVTNPLQARKGDVATALPSGLAIAATFDPKLAYQAGALVGTEARSKGFNIVLGPGVNLARDPRGGRNFEYLGEDPLLTGTLAGQMVRGIQSQRVVATLKHFVLNDQESHRNDLDAVIDEGELRESDLLAFELAVEQGRPGAVMCGYNRINGIFACENDLLLNQILKSEWKFPGWVMSDWGSAHSADTARRGLDQQAGANFDEKIWFDQPLRQQLENGRISRARVSDMVRRILRSLFTVGVEAMPRETAIDYDTHAATARDIAREGIVLLKNEAILPISNQVRTVLVVGGHADIGVLSGAGSSQVTPVGGPAAHIPVGGSGPIALHAKQLYVPSSPVQALRSALPNARIDFDSGYFPEATAAAARSADMVILFATQWQAEARDAGSMILPEGQDRLIDLLARANPSVVVVLETGNPVRMPWLDEVKAVVAAWYPGQQGGAAIADVLTGQADPAGRLPMSFPAGERQNERPELPGLTESDASTVTVHYSEGSDVGYRWFAARNLRPLFPFGYGLTYTRFAYGGLALHAQPTLAARVTIRNTGERAGADVPQLYLVEAAGRKLQRLVAFDKVRLKPGESRTLTLTIDPRIVADWVNGAWQIAAGDYVFALGRSAADLEARVTVRLAGRRWHTSEQTESRRSH